MTLADIAAVQNCDIFIYNGGDSDAWAEDILEVIDRNDLTVLRLMDHAELLFESDGAVVVRDSDDDNEEYDEHIWTSPKNASLMCRAIERCLEEADPAGENEYSAAAQSYIKELDALDEEFRDIAAVGSGKTLVFADRFPFLYLAHEYGFQVYAAFSGCSAEAELSAAAVAELIDVVTKNGVSAIFRIEFSSGGAAESIADKTGAVLLRLNSCHNVSKKDFENGVTYLDLMRQNAARLREALS
jgi:zinc transport system substrate-binding protein